MSTGGDFDKWNNWVPGDPVPNETGRPVAEPLQPHDADDSDGATPSSGSGLVMVLLALGLLTFGGAGVFLALGATESEPANLVVVDRFPTTTFVPGAVEAEDSLVEFDLVHGSIDPALDVLRTQLGNDLRAHRLVVYPGYLVATVEPPDLPGELDRWVIYPSSATGPTPERNIGDVEAELFHLSEIAATSLPPLVSRALAEMGIADPTSTYLIIERSGGEEGQITVAVYVSSDRRSGYMRFGVDGEVLAAHSP